ncbi:MAG: cytochrome c biogenesis protein CcsA [Candidatus Bathyarchaeota archaeon]|nr:MAG: cytochrome c biogenesis protein CcsA [Candidatus Bathyarchaeota archaeon]
MELQKVLYPVVAVVVNIIASYVAFVAGPSPVAGLEGDIYRIFYTHTPTAWICYLTLGISSLSSLLFLAYREAKYDTLAEVAAILGLIYGAVALATGSVWANAIWGIYWHWDPRETTTLILWIAYLGYISLRFSIDNLERRGLIGAVYNIVAFSTIPLSYLSFRLWQSLHPQIIIPGSGISATLPVIETLLVNLVSGTLLCIFLLKMMYTTRILQKRVEALTQEERG